MDAMIGLLFPFSSIPRAGEEEAEDDAVAPSGSAPWGVAAAALSWTTSASSRDFFVTLGVAVLNPMQYTQADDRIYLMMHE